MNSNDNDSVLDWKKISQQIPESNHPDGPIHLIRTCLENEQEQDTYEQMETRLNLFIENLKKSFNEINK